jgi:AGCS family alanine or glycine:cation symporter
MGGMTVINMPVILYLGKYAYRALRDYERQVKSGGVTGFKRADIGLEYETDYWN